MPKKVDLKLYSEYERIAKAYNKMRKRILKKQQKLKDDSTGGRLPALVVPQRHRRIQQRTALKMSRRMLREKMKALYKIISKGEASFYKDFKRSYLELYRTYIIEVEPDLRNGMYSKEQIADMFLEDPKMAQFMHDYNSIITMNPERFLVLLYTGKIPEFKWLYRELVQGLSGYDSFAERMHNAIKLKSVRGEGEESRDEALEKSVSTRKETKARMYKSRVGMSRHKKKKEESEEE